MADKQIIGLPSLDPLYADSMFLIQDASTGQCYKVASDTVKSYVGGSGTVKKVNNVSPNVSGEVTLVPRDIGAVAIFQDTQYGSLLHIVDSLYPAIRNPSLAAVVKPEQDFHGYGHPWAAGKGANQWDCEYERGNITSDGSDGTSTTYNRTKNYIPVTGGAEYRVVCPTANKRIYWYDASKTYISSNLTQNEVKTAPANAAFARMYWPRNDVPDPATSCALNYPSSVTGFSPYENICPFTGRTETTVYVNYTASTSGADVYHVNWENSAGTIYGGWLFFEPSPYGMLSVKPYYSSYNGQYLVGPWVSSHDEYVAGTTPTTGAEVVDLGAEGTRYELNTGYLLPSAYSFYVWNTTGDVRITYDVDVKQYIDRKIAEALTT